MGNGIQRAEVDGIDKQQRVVEQAESGTEFELDGFELPADFQMPTMEEIEHDLALGEPGWISLMRTSEGESARTDSRLRRVYAGRSWRAFVFLAAVCAIAAVSAGLATAQVFSHQGVATYVRQGASHIQTNDPSFIWTARGPRRIDHLINSGEAPMRTAS
jgi:hypothetical protein